MRRLLLALLTAALLAGCGGAQETGLTPAAAGVLGKDVDAITSAARADDATRVQELLLQLREDVERLQADGELSEARGARVLAAAARVATDVGAPEPEVVVTPAPAPQPDSAADEQAAKKAEEARKKAEEEAKKGRDEGDKGEGDDD